MTLHELTETACPMCDGAGWLEVHSTSLGRIGVDCPQCSATGRIVIVNPEPVSVYIPADVLTREAPTYACMWFARCERTATTEVEHPILGPVPCCSSCAEFAAG